MSLWAAFFQAFMGEGVILPNQPQTVDELMMMISIVREPEWIYRYHILAQCIDWMNIGLVLDAGSAGEGRSAMDFLLYVWTRELFFFFFILLLTSQSHTYIPVTCVFLGLAAAFPLAFSWVSAHTE